MKVLISMYVLEVLIGPLAPDPGALVPLPQNHPERVPTKWQLTGGLSTSTSCLATGAYQSGVDY